MNDLIRMVDGQPKVSSKDISDKFEKVHRNVLRDISNLEIDSEFRVLNFEQSSYTSLQGKVLPCVNMTRDGFTFLCMGFTGKKAAEWKLKYIRAFNQMEQAIKSAPETMIEINRIVRLIEENKAVASLHGRELAKYRKVKQEQEELFDAALDNVQLTLGLDK